MSTAAPTPQKPLALCWGTVIGAPLETLIEAASSAELPAVTLTARMYEESRARHGSDAALRTLLRAAQVEVHAIDPLIGALPGTPCPADVPAANRGYFEISEDDCYRAAEALDAETINLAHFGGGAVSEQAFIDCLGGIAQRARRRGVRLTLEFLPESAIPDLAHALRLTRAVAADNLAILFDVWHFARSGGTLEQLTALPADAIGGLQISDRIAPPPGTAYAPMSGRLLPGEGELPLSEWLPALLRRQRRLTAIGVEVFSEELKALTPSEIARRVAASAGGLLARLP
jgi:sugar phosphate isomerase/epimerase